jgi:hypothetical protein
MVQTLGVQVEAAVLVQLDTLLMMELILAKVAQV